MTTEVKVIAHRFEEHENFNREVNKALKDGFKFVQGNSLTAFGLADAEEVNIEIVGGSVIAILAK